MQDVYDVTKFVSRKTAKNRTKRKNGATLPRRKKQGQEYQDESLSKTPPNTKVWADIPLETRQGSGMIHRYVPGGVFPRLPMPGYTRVMIEDLVSDAIQHELEHNRQTNLEAASLVESQDEAKPKTPRKKVASDVLKSVRKLVTTANDEDLLQLSAILTPEASREQESTDDESEPLWSLELANLKLLYERRRELLKDSLTSTQVAELLDWKNRKTVHDRLKAKEIIGIKDRGVYKFPLWQFDPQGENGILDSLPSLLAALDISDFRKLSWLTKPLRPFNNLTPVEILKRGNKSEIEDLVIEAEGVGVAQ